MILFSRSKINFDESIGEKIRGYFGQLHTWSKLRNAIAHSTWKEGERPGASSQFQCLFAAEK